VTIRRSIAWILSSSLSMCPSEPTAPPAVSAASARPTGDGAPATHGSAKLGAADVLAVREGTIAVEAAMTSRERTPGAAARDQYRHPAETLAFFGLTPTMTVLDVGPGDGWYTELLAPALAKRGRYITTVARPDAPPGSHWGSGVSTRFVAFLRGQPERYRNVETLVVDYEAPKVDLDGQVDMVLLLREVHMMKNWATLDAWLRETARALKPGGILGIEDHRAARGADPNACATTGYLPEAWVIARVEAAGFALVGRSDINANPRDTKNYAAGVWTLPPTLSLGDEGRERYLAIGESDRMTLKFVKVVASDAIPVK
jgi:predicted methyltransferase